MNTLQLDNFVLVEVEVEGKQRVLAIWHGGSLDSQEWRLLWPLLDCVGFQPGVDRLWSVGDFVDRGSNPLDLVRFFRDTPGCGAVLGNHDAMFLSWFLDNANDMSRTWQTNYGHEWLFRYAADELREMADYFATLPLSQRVELADGRTVGLVHGQLTQKSNFGEPLEWGHGDAFDDLATEGAGFALSGRDVALVSRQVARDQNARAISALDIKRWLREPVIPNAELIDPRLDLVISGHTPFYEPATPMAIGNHLFIDTLAYDKCGRLSLVDPVAGVVYQQKHKLAHVRSGQKSKVTLRSLPAPLSTAGWLKKLQ